MDLKGLQEYAETLSLGTMGTDLFVSNMPETVKEGVIILQDLEGTMIDHEIFGYRKGDFQIVVRSASYTAGLERAQAIATAFTLVNTVISGRNYRYIRPKHEPVPYPVSKGNLQEFSVNYQACYDI